MNITTNKVLMAAIAIGLIALIAKKKPDIDTLDQQAETSETQIFQNMLGGDNQNPLSNTKSTLTTLVATNKNLSNELSNLKTQLSSVENELGRVKREKSQAARNENVDALMAKFEILSQEHRKLKEDFNSATNINVSNESTLVNDITGGDIEPLDLRTTPAKSASTNSGNSFVDLIAQPELIRSPSTKQQDEITPLKTESPNASLAVGGGSVVITQSDIKYSLDRDGNTIAEFPSSGDKPDTLNASTGNNLANALGNESARSDDEITDVPIYTIGANSTFFGSVSMSAIIGRVPINNVVSNPFRFKVLVGADNMATNGLYIPHVQEMSLSGFAEGDFTLECARGVIDTATFTFSDGTIRTVRSEDGNPIAWISDTAGIPCISGQYITNFPSYVAKQGTLTGVSSFAASIAQSAVSTTTTVDGVTQEIINDSTQKALGDGFQAGTAEIVKWNAERQQSAFDVVYVKPGEQLVINFEQQVAIDYEINGRKTFHEENAQEYLQW
ncbi:TIGR03752 family integrating conjugative element protein [Enterovibrio norvegicus]|uniref:TIGR03752 family integrating conjugative element protein n=1 Tax=Enterovibrio norvegicus TaxID=188144 RepID=UPI000C858AAF|nr:TIGR03752 family integrating conjugative element protein [Enterovibrio norvegicus]PMH64429.1 integrating conjugative element protein [Enterovibrio norvegicus]